MQTWDMAASNRDLLGVHLNPGHSKAFSALFSASSASLEVRLLITRRVRNAVRYCEQFPQSSRTTQYLLFPRAENTSDPSKVRISLGDDAFGLHRTYEHSQTIVNAVREYCMRDEYLTVKKRPAEKTLRPADSHRFGYPLDSVTTLLSRIPTHTFLFRSFA